MFPLDSTKLSLDLFKSYKTFGDEWYFPYFDGYTGPYYSAGKLQGSTTKNQVRPTGRLGYLSREHDFRYATANSLDDLDRADQIYYDKTREMSLIPRTIGAIPLYGNALARKVARATGETYVGAEAGGPWEMPFKALGKTDSTLSSTSAWRLTHQEPRSELRGFDPEGFAEVQSIPIFIMPTLPVGSHSAIESPTIEREAYGYTSDEPQLTYSGKVNGGGAFVKEFLAGNEYDYKGKMKNLYSPLRKNKIKFNSKKKFKNKVYMC